jgi:hypothetical protein
MTHRPLLAACLLVLACNGDGPNDDDTGFTPGLGRVLDRIEPVPEVCETFTTSEGLVCVDIEGAERVYAAELVLEPSGQVSGRFYVVLYANEAWQDTDDWRQSGAASTNRCTVAMPVTGTHELGGGACGACDRSLTYSVATIDVSLTDCPQGYVNDIRRSLPFNDAFWGVQLASSGSAIGWDTQRAWAPNGVHQATDVQGGTRHEVLLWSNGACQWYGTGECS